MHFVLLCDCLDHEIGTVADVSDGSEQNRTHGDSDHFGRAIGKKFAYRGRALDAKTGVAKSAGKEHYVGWRIIEDCG